MKLFFLLFFASLPYTKHTVYSSFLSLTEETTISYYYRFIPIKFLFFTISMKSSQNLSPGRFRHPEAESEVKNLQNFHPDLEISISYFLLISYYFLLTKFIENRPSNKILGRGPGNPAVPPTMWNACMDRAV